MVEFIDILARRFEEDPGLTPAGLAVKAGLDNSTIRRMLSERRNPRIDTIKKICDALGESYEDFMAGGGNTAERKLVRLIGELTPEEQALLLAAAEGLRARR